MGIMVIKKIASMTITMVFIISLIPVNTLALGNNAYDLQGHWAENAVKTCIAYGIINNITGNYRPDSPITCEYFVSMVNIAFGYTNVLQTSPIMQFLTVSGDFVPDGTLTRDQAVNIIFKLLRLESTDKSKSAFTDINNSQYSGAVTALEIAGFIAGNKGRFNPQGILTQGESAQIITNIVGLIADKNTDVNGNTYKNITIRKPGVTLKNAVITGDLYITEGVGDGDVWLEDVEIGGRLIVAGGGENSVHLVNSTAHGGILADKPEYAGNERLSIRQRIENPVVTLNGSASEIIISDEIVITVNTGISSSFSIHPGQNGKAELLIGNNSQVEKIKAAVPLFINGGGRVASIDVLSQGVEIGNGFAVLLENIKAESGIWFMVGGLTIAGTGILEQPPPPTPQPDKSGQSNSNYQTPDTSPEASPGPSIGGTAGIIGIYKIGEELSVDVSGITGNGNGLIYRWEVNSAFVGDGESYIIKGSDAGKSIQCVILRQGAQGTVIADGTTIPYSIEVINTGIITGDSGIILSSDTGYENDKLTLRGVLGGGGAVNTLRFFGGSGLGDIQYAGNVSLVYTVTPADAQNGLVTITAAFSHTDKSFDRIEFASSSDITKTYGDSTFKNAITYTGEGSGGITYHSSNETVAEVNSYGVVTIKAAGISEITATKSEDNFFSQASNSYTLTVLPKALTHDMLTGGPSTCVYNSAAQVPYFTIADSGMIESADYDFYCTDNINAGIGKLIIIGKRNYSGTLIFDFAIIKANPVFVTPTGLTAVYGDTLRSIYLPDGFSWENDTLTGEVGENTFTAKYTPEDIGNYNIVEGIQVTVIYGKAEGLLLGSVPVVLGTPTRYSITVSAITVPLGYAVEYAISTQNDEKYIISWQDETYFNNLSPDTGYYVFARIKENENYLAGLAAVSEVIRTAPSVTQLSIVATNPAKIVSPIENTSFMIEISGFAPGTDIQGVKPVIQPVPGLTFNAQNVIFNASDGSLRFEVSVIYDCVTPFPYCNALVVVSGLSNLPQGYLYSGGAVTVDLEVADGKDSTRAIPVDNGNIMAFNLYALNQNLYYRLVEDITLYGTDNWIAIGAYPGAGFKGCFDGGGHTIYGLSINKSSINYQGLFGYIETDGVVKNLGIKEANIAGMSYTGGIAGQNEGIIENCAVSAVISGMTSVGGIAGHNNSGTIRNCRSEGRIDSRGAYTGGIAGYNLGEGKIYFSYSLCVIDGGVGQEAGYAGGIAGWNRSGEINGCVALNASVSANTVNAGRITGDNRGTLVNNYARADMKVTEGGQTVTDYSAVKHGVSTSLYNTLGFWQAEAGWDFQNIWSWAGLPLLFWEVNTDAATPKAVPFNDAIDLTIPEIFYKKESDPLNDGEW